MKIKKAIFLDIDGVIATVREFNMTHMAETYITKYNIYPYNPGAVKILNEILEITKADIVISSDWRLHYTMEELEDIFFINGVKEPPIIGTPDFYKKHKGKELEEIRTLEIQAFLEEHEVDQYVVVDDLDMSEDFGDRFVLCGDSFEGIKKTGLQNKIIKLLC